ncbi:MAG: (4Fe-4S)-binding protein [Flammeovirgaceae bacterium]
MKDITKKYTNGEVTIVWKPSLCIHSAICFNGLGDVFHPKKLPWITLEKSTSEKIIEQVKKCPSGALSYYLNSDSVGDEVKVEAETIVETTPNGPLMVYGNVTIKDANGNLTKKSNATAFCRCGASANKPFCDGSHKKIGFEG